MAELLAPAGSIEALQAAVKHGADAVYLGFSGLNARIKADAFNPQNVAGHISFCHQNGVKVYVAVNASVKQEELEKAKTVVSQAIEAGADALIIADLALIDIIRGFSDKISIHASTQFGVHNLEGALVAEKLGFSRIILSRETALEDIKKISDNTGLETEAFVHGAMCVAFSGNCLMSAVISGNSGNRGLCLQPCRQLYKNSINGKKAYWLSMSDLCLINRLKELQEAGVSSFKIEGRLRRPEYTAEVVRQYRHAIDCGRPSKDAVEKLKLIYNRGNFSEGYQFKNENLIYPYVQGHTGLLSAKVIKCERRKGGFLITAESVRRIDKGDGYKAIQNGRELCGGSMVRGFIRRGNNICFESNKFLPPGTEIHVTTSVSQLKEFKRQ